MRRAANSAKPTAPAGVDPAAISQSAPARARLLVFSIATRSAASSFASR